MAPATLHWGAPVDPLAHTLVGLSLARAGLGRATRFATAALVIGANLPDIDGLSHIAGTDAALACRRGVTHGLPALALLPPLLAAAVAIAGRFADRIGRRPGVESANPESPRFAALLALSCLAVWSHPCLDWLNTYGMRWLMPFSGRWWYGDTLFIIDPWLWLLLGGSLFLAGPARAGTRRRTASWAALALVTSLLVLASTRASILPLAARLVWLTAILGLALFTRFRPPRPETSARRARIGLGLAIAYIGAMLAVHALALAGVKAALAARGEPAAAAELEPSALMVGPLPANPLVWDVVLRQADGRYRVGRFSWLDPGRRLSLADPEPADEGPAEVIAAARAAPSVQGLVGWARFPVHRASPAAGGGYEVEIRDLRYSRQRGESFASAVVRLDRDLRVRE